MFYKLFVDMTFWSENLYAINREKILFVLCVLFTKCGWFNMYLAFQWGKINGHLLIRLSLN